MSKICTDVEQSKKLIELGIDTETADMWYLPKEDSYKLVTTPSLTRGILPAWSLTALLEILNSDYYLEKSMLDQSLVFTYAVDIDGVHRTKEYDNPLDAAFDMVCWWLKENGKI